jgi:hypothetical protein
MALREVAGRTWPIRLGYLVQPINDGMWVSTDSKATSIQREEEGAVKEAYEQVGEILDRVRGLVLASSLIF